MAAPQKRRIMGGRITPKGGQAIPGQSAPATSGESPAWVPVLMFSLLALGVLIIFFNYVGWMPGGTSNSFLLLGLGSILGGIITATQYH